jgi:hypothetical protein
MRFVEQQRILSREIGRLVLLASSGIDRLVPNSPIVKERLKLAAWSQVLKPYYIGSGDNPFRADVPQSPYARLLYDGIRGNVEIVAENQASFLRRHVRDDFVLNWLTGERPLLPIGELRATYDPFHRFVDPNGYTLSDRVWNASINTRARINSLLDYHIGNGTSAVDIAELLEDFLTPGAKLIKTNTPYGTEGSYAARRLARTEITAASGRATINGAIANPFVNGVQWRLSLSHRGTDICDINASGGPNGDGVYTPDTVPPYPAHPHDLCSLRQVPAGNIADLVNELRLDILAANPRARLLQGLFNATFFVQAMLSGLFAEIVDRLRELVEV